MTCCPVKISPHYVAYAEGLSHVDSRRPEQATHCQAIFISADLSELVIVMLDTIKWICCTVSKRYISAYVGENECVCVYKNN